MDDLLLTQRSQIKVKQIMSPDHISSPYICPPFSGSCMSVSPPVFTVSPPVLCCHPSESLHTSVIVDCCAALCDRCVLPISAGTLSPSQGEVQISAHPSISNHAPHLDERQAPATWLTGMLTWGEGDKHHRRSNTKTAGAQPRVPDTQKHARTLRTNQRTLRAHLSSSRLLNNVTHWYPWLISLCYVSEQGTGCHWSCSDGVLPLITQTQHTSPCRKMFYCPLQRWDNVFNQGLKSFLTQRVRVRDN